MLWIGALSLSLAGCGGSTSDIASPATLPAESRQQVVGRALLDEPIANGTVTFLRADGTPIPTDRPVVTDGSGIFRAQLNGFSGGFRASVTAGNESYASEYEAPPGDDEMVVITPLTNLVAVHHAAHPGTSLAASEAAVRTWLRLPAEQSVRRHMVTTTRAGFHVGKYLQAARGASNYAQQVVASIDGNVTVPRIPNALFAGNLAQFWTQEGTQLGVAVVTTALAFAKVPVGPLIGWVVGIIEGQFGGGGEGAEFQALAQEIEEVAQEIFNAFKELSREVQRTSLQNLYESTSKATAEIDAARGSLTALLTAGATATQKDAFAQNVTANEFLAHPGDIYNKLNGSAGLLQRAAVLYGLAATPYYTNSAHYSRVVQFFDRLAAYQTRGTQIIVDGFHSLSLPLATNQAQTYYDNYLYYIASEATQVPQPLDSDEVIYVRSKGLIFYRHVFAPQSYDDAQVTAALFTEGRYANWRVATKEDLFCLIEPEGGARTSLKDLEGFGLDVKYAERATGLHVIGADDPVEDRRGFYLDFPNYNDSFPQDWDERARPFMLVCQVDEQDSALLPALTQVQSLKVESEGDRVRALAEVKANLPRGRTYTKQLDYTNLVAWSVDKAGLVRVQNPPASANVTTYPDYGPPVPLGAGQLTWFGPGNVTVTATAHDVFNPDRPLTNSTLLSRASVPAARLLKVRLSPRGLVMNQTTANISLLGYYSDGQIRAVNNVTFTTSIPQAQVVMVGSQLQVDLTGRPPGPVFGNFTVTAQVPDDTGVGVRDTLRVNYNNIP